MSLLQFQVRKDAMAVTRCVEAPLPEPAEGQVCVRIDHFAYTANNITYAAFGEAMHYWQFFPPLAPAAPEADDAGGNAAWGVIPVWGFGTVVASRVEGVAVGERLYGYWPMATHALLTPVRISAGSLVDGAPHRAALHGVYNQYTRCAADPYYRADTEAEQALLRPLFLTAWLIDDFLADQDWFGAREAAADGKAVVLLSSASSKTAVAMAALLARREGVELVGLTSPRNVAYCESLGIYHRVVTYDALETLDGRRPCLYVDYAGDAPLRLRLHRHFSGLVYNCAVGGTHHTALAGGRDLPGPKPVLFFAPAQVKKRAAEWGPAGFQERLVAAWHAYLARVQTAQPPWLQTHCAAGPGAVREAHARMVEGAVDPREGWVLSLHTTVSA